MAESFCIKEVLVAEFVMKTSPKGKSLKTLVPPSLGESCCRVLHWSILQLLLLRGGSACLCWVSSCWSSHIFLHFGVSVHYKAQSDNQILVLPLLIAMLVPEAGRE